MPELTVMAEPLLGMCVAHPPNVACSTAMGSRCKERSTVTQVVSRCNYWPVVVICRAKETIFTLGHL